ncbi:hypothetical protein EV424DRAFT_522849 [Suillus variegatus]|nr:hypothetical protein EV424DRAFT_522849 [Suillus variegatus]
MILRWQPLSTVFYIFLLSSEHLLLSIQQLCELLKPCPHPARVDDLARRLNLEAGTHRRPDMYSSIGARLYKKLSHQKKCDTLAPIIPRNAYYTYLTLERVFWVMFISRISVLELSVTLDQGYFLSGSRSRVKLACLLLNVMSENARVLDTVAGRYLALCQGHQTQTECAGGKKYPCRLRTEMSCI